MLRPNYRAVNCLLFCRSKIPLLIILFYLTVFFRCAPVFSQESFYQLSRRDFLFSCHFLDPKTGWIVGKKGLLLNSIDGGENWVKVETRMNNALNDITFVGNDGWIVGQGGIILHTNDGGKTWEKQKSNCDISLMQVSFPDKQRGVVIGQGGTILLTEDGGLVWNPIQLDWATILPTSLIDIGVIAPNLYDVFFVDNAQGWIVGDNGIVLYTSDGGKQWSLLRAGPFPALFAVFFKNNFEGWATGQNGVLLHTKNGGKTWETMNVSTKASLFKIRLVGEYGVFVGNGGTVFQTSNGGVNWNPIKLEMALPYPWFGDLWIACDNNSSCKIILIGKSIIKKISLK